MSGPEGRRERLVGHTPIASTQSGRGGCLEQVTETTGSGKSRRTTQAIYCLHELKDWELEVKAETPGIDYAARFLLPVYSAARGSGACVAPESDVKYSLTELKL